MLRRLVPFLLVLAGVGLFLFSRGDEKRIRPILRAAPQLPDATPEERARYFFDLIRSGKAEDLGSTRPSVWHDIGFVGLAQQGEVAAGYLLDEQRWKLYKRDPSLLANIFQLIMPFRAAHEHTGLYPFLLHWLDPRNCAAATGTMTWADQYRRFIFSLFTIVPDKRALPACREELARTERTHDLRAQAVSVLLLRFGDTQPVIDAYDRLPPTAAEPDGTTRYFVLEKMLELASERNEDSLRDVARRMRPLAERSLESEHLVERVIAARALLRLGDANMAERLLAEFRGAGEDVTAAWYALEALAAEQDHPFIQQTCLEVVRDPEERSRRDLAFYSALSILTYRARDNEETVALFWEIFDEDPVGLQKGDSVLMALLALDRARVLEGVKAAMRSDDPARRDEALALVQRIRLPEARPWIRDMARRSGDPVWRGRLLGLLVLLRDTKTEPLLIAGLDDESDAARSAMAARILDLGGSAGVDAVNARLLQGDEAALGAVLQRAVNAGGASVSARLLPGLLDLVAGAPGEQTRLQALHVLRVRGVLDDVREELIDAYRREPSHRVAKKIREVLVELAQR